MNVEMVFRPYIPEDREACIDVFNANCPEFFASNERVGYMCFLDTTPAGYEVCLVDGNIAGAFGLIGTSAMRRRLTWILLNPCFHGLGVGRAIMQRVAALASSEGVEVFDIAASHVSAPFFGRFGAVAVAVTPDGWGPGMHRVDMEMPLRHDKLAGRTHDR
jgi:GNAT superfamily N-acetyltransferase